MLEADGREIVSLSIFKVEIVLPDLISITNNLPMFVDRYILFKPTINPVGLICLLFLMLLLFVCIRFAECEATFFF